MIDRTMRSRAASLALSLVFLVLAPGAVAVYVPWWMTRWHAGIVPAGVDPLRLVGFVLTLVAAGVLLDAFWRFAWIGRGTPAPVMPPETLVISGLYRYVRNPMYVAVLTMIAGQALWLWRRDLALYAAAIFLLFHIVVRVIEEPHLDENFGEQYRRYCRHVRRWIPRLRPWDPSAKRYSSFLA